MFRMREIKIAWVLLGIAMVVYSLVVWGVIKFVCDVIE